MPVISIPYLVDITSSDKTEFNDKYNLTLRKTYCKDRLCKIL